MGFLAVILFIVAILAVPLNSPGLFVLGLLSGIISTIVAVVRHRQYKREMPKYEEKQIAPIDPQREPLSGTFVCKACGGSTTFNQEVYPSTACSYCGSVLPDVKEMILNRDQERLKRIDDDLERQRIDQRERLNTHLARKNEYIAVKGRERVEKTKETAKATLLISVAIVILLTGVFYAIALFIRGLMH